MIKEGMIKDWMVKDFTVLSTNATVSEVKSISKGEYAVIVDVNQAPVALANNEDAASLDESGDVQLIQVVSRLPRALVAGSGIAIERLVKAATAKPKIPARGTVFMDVQGVIGVLPVENLIFHLGTQGARFSPAIAKLQLASAGVGSSERGWTIPGKRRGRCIWVACARCGRRNCLMYIPAKGEVMPLCVNLLPPHRIEMKR